MMQLKKLSFYEPEIKEAENILYLKDEDGNDWYASQEKFSADRLKIAFTDDGIIRTADYDVSALWPVNMAVAEVSKESVPDGFNIDGNWMFDGSKIIPAPVDHVGLAEAEKQSLLQEATQAIAPLQDAVELEMASEGEVAQLAAWKKYRVLLNRVDTTTAPDIAWPEMPGDVA
ncbi:tail fiber assembly protein [Cronobacter sakazakii]|nr:tail fiber assembly protein [Cronobacter sakazakii]